MLRPSHIIGFVAALAASLCLIGLCFSAPKDSPQITWQATTDGKTITLTPILPANTGHTIRLTPGQFGGILVTASGSTPAILDWVGSITFGITPPQPPTPTPPTPKPPTPPTPIVKPTAMYLIYEAGDLDPKTASVRDGQAWKKAADAAGIKWLCFDDDDGAKKFPNATKRAQEAGLPAVVFLDKGGGAEAIKAPDTPAAMEALVKQKGGVK